MYYIRISFLSKVSEKNPAPKKNRIKRGVGVEWPSGRGIEVSGRLSCQ